MRSIERILLVSDTHISPVFEKLNVEVFTRILELEDYDMIIHGGDWGVVPFDIKEINKITDETPIFSTLGNHDSEEVLKAYGILIPDGEVLKVGGLKICSIGGVLESPPFINLTNGRPPEYFEKTAQRILSKTDNCDILVTHETQGRVVKTLENVLDTGKDRSVVDRVADEINPVIHLTGHVHAIELPPFTVINADGSRGKYTVARIITNETRNKYPTYAVVDVSEHVMIVKKPTLTGVEELGVYELFF